MSYIELREDISLGEFYCLLAEAYDAEELEDLDEYNGTVNVALAYHKPKKIKKFKFVSIDKAGTVPLYDGAHGVAAAFLELAVKYGGLNDKGEIEVTGNLSDFAKSTGREIIFPDGKGGYVNKQGDPVKRTRNTVVVPAHNKDRVH